MATGRRRSFCAGPRRLLRSSDGGWGRAACPVTSEYGPRPYGPWCYHWFYRPEGEIPSVRDSAFYGVCLPPTRLKVSRVQCPIAEDISTVLSARRRPSTFPAGKTTGTSPL